jgi:hypothetical protein
MLLWPLTIRGAPRALQVIDRPRKRRKHQKVAAVASSEGITFYFYFPKAFFNFFYFLFL